MNLSCIAGSQLEPYSKPPAGSVAERLGQRFMPTKKQLKAAGREDLIKLVTQAGGFMEVAQYLGLRAHRRPQGAYGLIAQHTKRSIYSMTCTV